MQSLAPSLPSASPSPLRKQRHHRHHHRHRWAAPRPQQHAQQLQHQQQQGGGSSSSSSGSGIRSTTLCRCLAAVEQERSTASTPIRPPSASTPTSSKVAHLSFPEASSPPQFSPACDSFTETHRIRGYEVRPDQRTTIVTVANLLQEIAGNHAVGMWGRTDTGFANMPSMKDLIFVMTRLQIRMEQYPRWGDLVTIETYFSADGRLAARRDWRITDALTGQVYGTGTSTWVSINAATRKLSKLPEDLRNYFLELSPKQPRNAIAPGETKKRLPDIDSQEQYEGPKQVARRSDVDMNGHINNVTYLAWALETMPNDVYCTHRVYEVEIDFKAECQAGNIIESMCYPLQPDGSSPGRSSSPAPDASSSPSSNGNHARSSSSSSSPSSSNSNGSLSRAGAAPKQRFLHSLRRCDDETGCYELVRCRTTWVPAECVR